MERKNRFKIHEFENRNLVIYFPYYCYYLSVSNNSTEIEPRSRIVVKRDSSLPDKNSRFTKIGSVLLFILNLQKAGFLFSDLSAFTAGNS